MNYYVLQVAPREEEKTEAHIRKILPPHMYDECFHATRIMRKKFHGEWVEVHEKLLPGYVFVTTGDAEALYIQLKKIPLLTKLLGRDLEYFIRLSEQEEKWLDLLLKQSGGGDTVTGNSGGEQAAAGKDRGKMNSAAGKQSRKAAAVRKYEVGLSQIDIREGNEIRIVSGPLADMEGMVKKINLHKMIAEVEVPFMNGSTVIHLGIETVERREK